MIRARELWVLHVKTFLVSDGSVCVGQLCSSSRVGVLEAIPSLRGGIGDSSEISRKQP